MAYDAVHFYMSDVTSRVVAKSGIPTDRYHLGKIIMEKLQEDSDFVMQIDGGTGESETNGSVLKRIAQGAVALRNLGLQKGDVMVLMGPNHIDICIPLYAALCTGVIVAAVDETLGVLELKDYFTITIPTIIFCQSKKTATVEKALDEAGIKAKIVTFDENSCYSNFSKLLKDTDDRLVQDFRPTDFDTENTTAFLSSTSGTTGSPKAAILTHKNLCYGLAYFWVPFFKFPTPTRMILILSPCQWLTAGITLLSTPIFRVTRLQTSKALTPEHFTHLLNKYKPTYLPASCLLMNNMISACENCDFTCFEYVLMGGSAVSEDIIEKVKEKIKSKNVYSVYGITEASGVVFTHNYPPPKGSTGNARGGLEYRLVDQNTEEDVTEANIPGELYIRGLQIFKGYYRNPEQTAAALTEDGWFKTGDICYRDDYWHFYFVERCKFLLKYRSYQIAPAEVEMVIQKHPGVAEVCVTGIPDSECGDLAVACVVPKPAYEFTAQEIKDLVKESLADSKQLRGGVIFLKELPLTATSKINRRLVKDLALTMQRE